SLQRVFFKRGGKNHQGGIVQNFQKFDAVELGHLNVQEHDIDFVFLEQFIGLQSIFTRADQFKVLVILQISFQYFDGQRLVVNDDSIDHSSLIFVVDGKFYPKCIDIFDDFQIVLPRIQ